MKKITCIIACFLVLVLFSCDYQFSEDYYKKIEIIEPSVSLSLINFKENDTLIKSKEIKYRYNASDKNLLYQIDFSIDNKIIHQSSNKQGNFPLEIKRLSNGNHTLKIEYIFRLGSESLADLTGNELIKKEETVSFFVNNNVPLEIEKLELRDGTIYIHFKPYELEEELFKTIIPTYIVESEYGSIEYNIFENSLYNGAVRDRRSFASKLTYSTRVKNSFTETVSKKKTITIPDTFKLELKVTDSKEAKIEWTEHALYNNVDLKILYNSKNEDIDIRLTTGASINAKGGEQNIPYGGFGSILKYIVYNEAFFSSDNIELINKNTTLGTRFETPENGFNKIIYSSQNNRFYALAMEQINENSNESNVYIYELASDNLQTIKKTKITTSKNIQGDLIKDASGNLVIDLNSKSIVIDINTLSIIGEYLISKYSDYENGSIIRFRENILFKDNLSNYGKKEIFDTSNKNKIFTSYENSFLGITNNGKYFTFKDKIYKIENSAFTEIAKSPQQGSSILIKGLDMDVDSNKLYILSGTENFISNNLYEFDLNSSISRKIPELPSYIVNFYFSNDEKKLICNHYDYTNDELYILDITNNQIKSINANRSSTFFVFNNKLISNIGSYLDNFF